MHVVELFYGIGWAAFWIYWIVAAFSMKRGRPAWSHDVRARVVIWVLAILLLRVRIIQGGDLTTDPLRTVVGIFLFVLGLGFAIWARLHIGRNWGTPMSQKTEPELVTSGPYRLVRHPIYSGILVAGVGTATGLNWSWLTVVCLVGIYFVYSAIVEERFLTERFPDAYPEYKRTSRMLVPFIF